MPSLGCVRGALSSYVAFVSLLCVTSVCASTDLLPSENGPVEPSPGLGDGVATVPAEPQPGKHLI